MTWRARGKYILDHRGLDPTHLKTHKRWTEMLYVYLIIYWNILIWLISNKNISRMHWKNSIWVQLLNKVKLDETMIRQKARSLWWLKKWTKTQGFQTIPFCKVWFPQLLGTALASEYISTCFKVSHYREI